MSLTNQDLEAIKKLLDKQKTEIISDTESKIAIAVTNVNRESKNFNLFKETQTVNRLRDEILTSEENLKKILTESIANLEKRMNGKFEKIDKRFESIDNRFANIDAQFKIIDFRFNRVDESLTNISQGLVKFIGEVETDNRAAHKNFDGRLRHLENSSVASV